MAGTRAPLGGQLVTIAAVLVALVAIGVGLTTRASTERPPLPVSITGTEVKTYDSARIPAGRYRVKWNEDGHRHFVVIAARGYQNASSEILVDAAAGGPRSGEVTFRSDGGAYVFAVLSPDAAWRLTFTWMGPI